MQNNKDSGEVNPSPENQLERDSAITENFTAGKVQSTGKYLMYQRKPGNTVGYYRIRWGYFWGTTGCWGLLGEGGNGNSI